MHSATHGYKKKAVRTHGRDKRSSTELDARINNEREATHGANVTTDGRDGKAAWAAGTQRSRTLGHLGLVSAEFHLGLAGRALQALRCVLGVVTRFVRRTVRCPTFRSAWNEVLDIVRNDARIDPENASEGYQLGVFGSAGRKVFLHPSTPHPIHLLLWLWLL